MLVALFFSGCAYTTKNMVPYDAKSIYVELFSNDTYRKSKTDKTFRKDIDNVLTDELMKKLMQDGSLKVTSKDNADLMLEGRVVYYCKDPLRYASITSDLVDEYRITIRAVFTLTDLRTNKVLIKDEEVYRVKDYYVSGTSMSTEDSAVKQASEDLAKYIIIKVVEGW